MQPVILLHGAIGAMDQLLELENKLSEEFKVYRLNFSGHGGKAFPIADFSIPSFAKEIIDFLDEKEIKTISVFGYSMGGYVGMYMAKQYPKRINKLITLATKFDWNETISAREVNMLRADKIEEKLPDFASSLKIRHAPNNWKTVLEKTAAMLLDMGNNNPLQPEDYEQINQPVLLILGDRDKMVSLDETVAIYKKLPHAQLAVLPDSPHPIEMIRIDRLANELKQFIM